jgi:hypothetical protein
VFLLRTGLRIVTLSRFVTIGAKLRGRATRTVFDSAIHRYLQCLHETAADGLQRRWYRAQFALAWPGRVSEILVDSGGVGHGVHDARTDARRRRHRPGAGDQRSMPVSSPDQIVLCDGKGVCCWPAHPRRTGATLCTHSDHRSLLLRGDAGVGKSTLIQRVWVKAAAQGWRVLLSTAVEAEASVIGHGHRPGSGAASDSRTARATVPSAPPRKIAASSRRS